MLGYAGAEVLISVVRYMPSANEIVMNGTQGSREQLASTDESAVELSLHAIVSPTVLAECCPFDESSNLPVENSEIRPACTGVVVPLGIGMLSCT